MEYFDYNEFRECFGMLHDQIITDASYDNGILRLTFGEYEIFRENYLVDTFYNRYKDYKGCMVEIFLQDNYRGTKWRPALWMFRFRNNRYKVWEPDFGELIRALKQFRFEFSDASVSTGNEIVLELYPEGDIRKLPRGFHCDQFRLSVYGAGAINFIWK